MMTIINTCKGPIHDLAGIVRDALKDPYDVNSCVPIPTVLENERVAIVPFVPSIYAQPFFSAFQKDREALAKYLPVDLGGDVNDFIVILEMHFRRSESSTLFAIIDKTKPNANAKPHHPPGQIAGIIGFINASARNLCLEIGPVIILKDFQGTFVSANAIGLVLKYVLDPPSLGGLAYRRVSWLADPRNQKSIAVAEKVGFKKEGVLNWFWVMPEGKEGKDVDPERLALEADMGRGLHHGRDSVVLSVCWDDWIGGVNELVEKQMKNK